MDVIANTLNNNTIVWEANPSFYDYIHKMTFNFNTNTFELCEGGGQQIYGIYQGIFTYSHPYITLIYLKNVDPYADSTELNDDNEYCPGVISMSCTKEFKIDLIEEPTIHFNGYCKTESNWTLTISESPLKVANPQTQDDSYPLTFYTGFNSVPCDVQYERQVRDEPFLKQTFVEKIDPSRVDVLIPNTERVRLISAQSSFHLWNNWRIVHLDETKGEIIVGYLSSCYPKYVVKNQQGLKYYVPQNDKYVESDPLILNIQNHQLNALV